MTHHVEETILERIEKGDKNFVNLIYDNYADNLYGVILQIIGDESMAQDILQASFIKIYKNINKYDPKKSKLFTWLLAICRNTAIDKLRSIKNKRGFEIQITETNVSNKESDSYNTSTIDLDKHLEGLDVKYKEVITLLYFEGFTQVEASEALGIPLGTVKSRLKIGLKTLQGIYGIKSLIAMLSILLRL